MGEKRAVKIAYGELVHLDIEEMNVLQGDLVELTEDRYVQLATEILETDFAFSPHVWQDPTDQKWWLVDGTQRRRVLTRLRSEGMEVPKIPCVPVQADSIEGARRRILQGRSQYGRMTEEGLYEFMSKGDIQFDEVFRRYQFNEVSLPDFYANFYGDPGTVAAAAGDEPGENDGQAPDEGAGREQLKLSLADRFMIPPFSVLNAREGWWQARKRAWIALGIQSHLGRGGACLMEAKVTEPGLNYYRSRGGVTGGSPEPLARYKAGMKTTFKSTKERERTASFKNQDKLNAIQQQKKPKVIVRKRGGAASGPSQETKKTS